ncbi:MAG: Gldg family protein [Weeksellaceae bacterium]
MKNTLAKLKHINIERALGLSRFKLPAIIALSVAFFLITNMLLSVVSARLDLSRGKAYTLSDASKKVLKDLPQQTTLTFYASNDVPQRFQPLKRDVKDLLEEYDRASGNVSTQLLDPKADTTAKTAAQEAGLPELQFSQLSQDNYAVTAGYFGIVVEYDGKKELIPQVTNVESLEYNLTSTLYKLSRTELPVVSIVGMDQTLGQQASLLPTFTSALSQQFDVRFASPEATVADTGFLEETNPEATLPIKLDPLTDAIVAFDTQNYSDQDIQRIKEYLKSGGKGIFFAQGVNVLESLDSAPASHNLFNLFKDYGITLQQNLVLSTASEVVNAGGQAGPLYVQYPLWVKTNVFNPDTSYFSNASVLTYPWTSSLTVDTAKQNVTATALVKSTAQSWEQKDTFSLQPASVTPPATEEFKQVILAAESKAENGSTIMVIPSSRFVYDQSLSQESSNLDFIMNVVNAYASGGALSGINQRAVNIYPLPEVPKNMQDIYKYTTILLLPGIFALYGAYRLLRRNKTVI